LKGRGVFAGHIAAGLALGRAERRVNVALFVAAAVLLDVLVWIFILLGWESVRFPPDFASSHQPAFVFPYSHGLLASVAWSALAAAFAWGLRRDRKLAVLLAAAVFSHWVLDFLVHRPELPVAGASSRALGLALWDQMPLALLLEATITVAGVALFLAGSGWPRARARALAGFVGVTLAFTVIGMTAAPAPPSAAAMAATSLATLAVVCGVIAWLARRPAPP
jgi:hypothetical protein